MKAAVSSLLLVALLAGCGALQRIDRFIVGDRNAEAEVVDPTELAADVTLIAAERTPSGVILRAEAVQAAGGYYDAQLRPVDPDALSDGIARFEFRVMPPAEAKPAPTSAARTISVAAFLAEQDLAGIRRIEVLGRDASRALALR